MRTVRSHGSGRLTVVFLAVLVPAAAALVWLGAELLAQDRALWRQRERERLDAAADAIARALALSVADVHRRLADDAPIEGALTLRLGPAVFSAEPAALLAWSPQPPALPEPPDDPFFDAEQLEYRGNAGAALARYGALARSKDDAARAGAWLRTARVHRGGGAVAQALEAYERLAAITGVAVNGMPVDLLARRQRCDLLRAADPEAFTIELDALRRDFAAGQWALARDAWQLVEDELSNWSGQQTTPPERRALAEAAAKLYDTWRDRSDRQSVLSAGGLALTLLEREDNPSRRVALLPPAVVDGWMRAALGAHPPGSLDPAILDSGGHAVAGTVSPATAVVLRPASETGLPWSIRVAPGAAWSAAPELEARRRILIGALAAILVLLAGGSIFVWRVVRHELAVARLQADFVAAVSHEFRTPVTSLRHVIELLEEDDDLPPERRRSFYGVLSRSTERLHRLLESLLDFGRMESGRKPYVLEPVDPATLVADVVREFGRDGASRGVSVEVAVGPGVPSTIVADRDALGHALWNLLDNAVKYSPGSPQVWVTLAPHPSGVAIAVRDTGVGVPAGERGEIFLRFVRGAHASRLGIKGTGVGLAIVTHIVQAHHGFVEVESAVGSGSTFRVVLPVAS